MRCKEKWLSGLKRLPRKRMADNTRPGVRIPPSPPKEVVLQLTREERLRCPDDRIWRARVVIVDGIITKANIRGGKRGEDIGGALYVWNEREVRDSGVARIGKGLISVA